ncbi:MAG: hypothetical protein KatS3mg124_0570 [Porticoccaceae bacterium]|nr:MAG: hypothetical protein KatS3mg124_0570 [Porticoccaceae bacterium]
MKMAVALLALVLVGCAANTAIDEFRPSAQPIALGQGERVVVLGRRDAGHYETDGDFVRCVADRIAGQGVVVVPEEAFVDALYPWFEPRTAPKGLARLAHLLEDAAVRERFQSLGVRYLIWLDGHTETRGKSGSLSCAVGPGGGGCFGFAAWDKAAAYEAVVWDVRDLAERGRVRVDSSGTSYLIGAVAPIPLLSPVKGDACAGLGGQLAAFFAEEEKR